MKPEFDVVRMAHLVEQEEALTLDLRRIGFSTDNLVLLTEGGILNHKAKQALKQLFKDTIVGSSEYEEKYNKVDIGEEFEIPVVWQMTGTMKIRAKTLDEAKDKVFAPATLLPDDRSYLDDSIEIDEEGLEENYSTVK